MSEKDALFVLAASYDSVEEAEADYETVKELYERRRASGTISTPPSSSAAPTARSRSPTSTRRSTRPRCLGRSGDRGLGCDPAGDQAWAWARPSVRVIGAVTGHFKGGMKRQGPEGARRRRWTRARPVWS